MQGKGKLVGAKTKVHISVILPQLRYESFARAWSICPNSLGSFNKASQTCVCALFYRKACCSGWSFRKMQRNLKSTDEEAEAREVKQLPQVPLGLLALWLQPTCSQTHLVDNHSQGHRVSEHAKGLRGTGESRDTRNNNNWGSLCDGGFLSVLLILKSLFQGSSVAPLYIRRN